MAGWASVWDGFADLWLAQRCALCDRPSPEPLCPNCAQKFQHGQLPQPATAELGALRVLTWGTYHHTLKHTLAALKYDRQRRLALPLGQALGQRWQQHPIPTRHLPVVVPIPLHPEKLRDRGFNQAALIAVAFCRQTGLSLLEQGLQRQRATLPQFGLGPDQRQQNLTDAFTLGAGWHRCQPTQPVLLLDDIYTTGATVRSAANTLRRAGRSVCGVAVCARARLEE
ncbi:MAG: ComF family protein [Leptolyngbya sp. RL_3_1]|nr:ComF family protein [Leptolyngbya sp. RL_3_1]